MPEQKTILVVDDNMVNHMILCKILKEGHYRVLEAVNGKEAVDLMNRADPKVDIMLLDLVMPVMDGFEVLRVMKETGQIASTPVIILTGDNQEDSEIRCLEAGASDFLKKPYNAQLVQHKVAGILRLWDNAQLLSQLERDRLTGLYNKEVFFRHAEEALAENPEQHFGMLYLNIEDFKMINARFGMAVGDRLLCCVADALKQYVGDERGLCGRIGADIFAILLKDPAEISQKKVGQFYGACLKNSPVKGASLKCGVYRIEDRTMSVTAMCDYAKIAEESVKHHYGLHYAVYDDAMSRKAIREHQLANYMEQALENHQFVVYMQPKHSTETEAVAGAEALVRWIHPELGFISPGEFIPLFEKNGFIVKLDYFVWQEVCKALRQWMDAGVKLVPISVNASRADFLSPDLPEKIGELVDRYDIPPEMLHIEVTESAYTDNPEQIISVVSTMRDMGFEIEMDDFGSGYSSLNMLSELPIDILKLDMRFMQSGSERLKGSKRNILSFIVSLSKWLQLSTVAEGVETQEEVEVLKSMGCNLIQGYYYAKPMPLADFEAYLKEHAAPAAQPEIDLPLIAPEMMKQDSGVKPLVLVVEDIESNREVMRALLSPQYRIATAENGQVAYDYIQAHESELSCILLDLLMPVMDGFQLLELMHRDKRYADIPVIITTETGSNGELRALNLGAHSFVAKPYNPDVLRHHVKKAVEEQRLKHYMRECVEQTSLLSAQAYRDELTHLLNRWGLKEAVERLPEDSAHTVIELDIDGLKQANDTYGHMAGDELITFVAKCIEEDTRAGDILARIGGDEFVIILCNMDNADIARKKMLRLSAKIESAAVGEQQIKSSCCSGIAVMQDPSQYEETYSRADAALYEAKRTGVGSCVIWHGEGCGKAE